MNHHPQPDDEFAPFDELNPRIQKDLERGVVIIESINKRRNEELERQLDQHLEEMAEDIVANHPSLTQLLLSISSTDDNPVHGQN